MWIGIARFSLALCIAGFTLSKSIAGDQIDDLYRLISSTVRSEARLPWTSVWYAGSQNIEEAYAQCQRGMGDVPPDEPGELDDFATDAVAPALGHSCVGGHQFDPAVGDVGEELGIPLTSCAVLEATAADIFGEQKFWELYEGRASKIDVQKNNAYELVSILIEVEDALSFYDVPEALWRDKLDEIEREFEVQINVDIHAFKHALFVRLNEFARSVTAAWDSGFNLAPMMGCGGGIFPFDVTVVPSDAVVEIIPKMFFAYCLDNGIELNTKNSCRHFLTDIRDGESVMLSGVYMYRLVENGVKGDFREIDIGRKLANSADIITRMFAGQAFADEDPFLVEFN